MPGANLSTQEHCTCMPGYHGANGGPCSLCPPGHRCPGGVMKEACPPGTFAATAGSVACQSCAPSFFSAEKSTSCWSVACPGNASRIPNVSSDAVFSGRDVCACSRPSEFFMVDVTLPGGLQWVQCKACVEERCAPGEFLYGCGDAITSSAVPRGECFRCPAGTFATNSAHREKCDECSQVICPAGTFLAGCGGNTSGVCESCPRHTYAGAAGRGRKKCKPCGFLDLCGVGEVLEGCGPYSTGTCTTCAADAFSSTDGLYLSSQRLVDCMVLSKTMWIKKNGQRDPKYLLCALWNQLLALHSKTVHILLTFTAITL